MQRDGFEGPQCWYRAMTENRHYEVEKDILIETSVKRIVRGLNHVCTDILIVLRLYNKEGAGRAIMRPNTSV